MIICLDPNIGKWFVINFNKKYNHQLAKTDGIPIFRSYRKIDDAKKVKKFNLAVMDICKKKKKLYFMKHKVYIRI